MWVTCSRAMCLAQCVLMLLRGLEKRVQQPSQGGAVSPVLLLGVLTVRTLPAAWLGWGWRLEPRQLAHTGLETGVGSGLDRFREFCSLLWVGSQSSEPSSVLLCPSGGAL